MASGHTVDDLEPLRAGIDAIGRALQSLDARISLGSRRTNLPRSIVSVVPKLAWSAHLPPELDLGEVADPLVRRLPQDGLASWDVPLPDGVVRMGKFTRKEQVKVRQYLMHYGRPVTLKAWVTARGVRRHGKLERRVRKKITDITDYRAPQLITSGAAKGVDYLVEALVHGRHPSSPGERLAAAEDLIPSLAAAYRRTDRGDVVLSDFVRPDFRQRVLTTLGEPGWDPALGSQAAMVKKIAGLIDADQQLRTAIGHGDLVATNIIRDPAGTHHLCDWEHGGVMPVAFDLAKLLLMTGDPAQTSAQVDRRLRALISGSRSSYTVEEQLALGICLALAWTPERRDRVGRAGRTEQFEAEQRSRLTWLAMLLDR